MQVKKRDGSFQEFDVAKIMNAITKANSDTNAVYRIESEDEFNKIIADIGFLVLSTDKEIEIETIQDVVELVLQKHGYYEIAKNYIRYRYKRELVREGNTTDHTIFELLNGNSEYWNTENSNKNPKVVTTQRDYLAGITSTDITRRFLLPKDVVEAHDNGIIHFHDADYFAQRTLHNCDLIDLKDMLINGTIINEVKIDGQHRLSTACTVATQIITAVASSQYGGCTISLTALAPFVRMSKEEIKRDVIKEFEGIEMPNLQQRIDEVVARRLAKEIRDSVQTFNYQINSMSTTNGQAPFLSVCMYINEDPKYAEEVAMLTEEFLKQRILGMKNKKGVYITPAFPKLLYILEEANIREDGKYYYLTELAAKCTAKRMVPDYISEKIMKQYKIDKNGNGQCYPCINKPVPYNSDVVRITYLNGQSLNEMSYRAKQKA